MQSSPVANIGGWQNYQVHQGMPTVPGVNREFFQYNTLGETTKIPV